MQPTIISGAHQWKPRIAGIQNRPGQILKARDDSSARPRERDAHTTQNRYDQCSKDDSDGNLPKHVPNLQVQCKGSLSPCCSRCPHCERPGSCSTIGAGTRASIACKGCGVTKLPSRRDASPRAGSGSAQLPRRPSPKTTPPPANQVP
jgi:hypothetical protein